MPRELRSTGLKSAMFVPLLSGSRVIGKLSAATRVAAEYGDVHVERLRTVGRMIGPFIEVIALLYRERRPAPPDGPAGRHHQNARDDPRPA